MNRIILSWILVLVSCFAFCQGNGGYDSYSKFCNKYTGKEDFNNFNQYGLQVAGNSANYKGQTYGLRCDVNTFQKTYHGCYDRYGGLRYCLYRLNRDGFLGPRQVQVAASSHATAQSSASSSGSGHASSSASAHAQVRVVNNGFVFNGKSYKLGCSEKKFYDSWNQCYSQYHDGNKCCGVLERQHLIVSATASASASSSGGTSTATAHAHAFVIVNGRFTFRGHGYKLTCDEKKFWDKWNRCNAQYHDDAKCCGLLQQQHLIVSVSATATASAGSGSATATAHAHAFVIVNGGFTFHGKDYKLACTEKNFWDNYDKCTSQYHDDDKCCEEMRKKKLIDYSKH